MYLLYHIYAQFTLYHPFPPFSFLCFLILKCPFNHIVVCSFSEQQQPSPITKAMIFPRLSLVMQIVAFFVLVFVSFLFLPICLANCERYAFAFSSKLIEISTTLIYLDSFYLVWYGADSILFIYNLYCLFAYKFLVYFQSPPYTTMSLNIQFSTQDHDQS